MTKLTAAVNQNDSNVYAILALNTGGSTVVEENILKCVGLQPLKTLMGMYKGECEPSYLVSYTDRLLVHLVAQLYGQESILVLSAQHHGQRQAKIVSVSDDADTLIYGNWVNHGVIKPANVDAYTYDPMDRVYYTIK